MAEETTTESGAAPDPSIEQVQSPEPTGPRTVPVTEAIRYRKRAQHAEQQLHDTQQQLHALSRQLAETQAGLTRIERSRTVDALLLEAEAVDLDAARALIDRELDAESAEGEPLIAAQLVTDLRRRKPYLFRQHGADAFADAMAARPQPGDDDPLEAVAERALETGRRRDLLAYLRLRRSK